MAIAMIYPASAGKRAIPERWPKQPGLVRADCVTPAWFSAFYQKRRRPCWLER
jgi:hypothetical protein